MKAIITVILAFNIIFSASGQDPLDGPKKKLTAGDFKGAKAELTKILDTNVKNKAALTLRGQARIALEDFYGAISDFTYALELDSTFTEALNHRAEAKIALLD